MSDKKHNLKGNCWDNKVAYPKKLNGDLNDICDKHESPRGDCDECPRCDLCDQEMGLYEEGK